MNKSRRRTRKRESRPRSLRTQRDVLCDVMLASSAGETWLTLLELSRLTTYGEASISAQLRHLRKPKYGSFTVEKRLRDSDAVIRSAELGALWEYRLTKTLRQVFPQEPSPPLNGL